MVPRKQGELGHDFVTPNSTRPLKFGQMDRFQNGMRLQESLARPQSILKNTEEERPKRLIRLDKSSAILIYLLKEKGWHSNLYIYMT